MTLNRCWECSKTTKHAGYVQLLLTCSRMLQNTIYQCLAKDARSCFQCFNSVISKKNTALMEPSCQTTEIFSVTFSKPCAVNLIKKAEESASLVVTVNSGGEENAAKANCTQERKPSIWCSYSVLLLLLLAAALILPQSFCS